MRALLKSRMDWRQQPRRRYILTPIVAVALLTGCAESAAEVSAEADQFSAPESWRFSNSHNVDGGCITGDCPRADRAWVASALPSIEELTGALENTGWTVTTADAQCVPQANVQGAFPICSASATTASGNTAQLRVSGPLPDEEYAVDLSVVER